MNDTYADYEDNPAETREEYDSENDNTPEKLKKKI